MDKTRIFHSSYCNELLDKYPNRIEIKHCIQAVQAHTAVHFVISAPHMDICLNKIKAISPYTEIDKDTTIELDKLRTWITNQKKRLLQRLDRYINHISIIKKDIQIFLQKRDDLCDEIMKLFEYHVERKRFQKLVNQLDS
jgi:hypothetical protein